MQVFLLFAISIVSLVLFIILVCQGAPWNNFQIFFLSIIIIVVIASLVGFIFSTIRQYCWKSTVSSNPTPTTLYTNPPPIGSAEAEFQNEYIPVFPMRQLKPRIDLDRPF
ncbi:hypothetical protein SSS_10203 [Sarcoptes scabiei]|uniref:Uncharacterized protein n=1 Tax=Sarcoptes scabiei TaxID=52283 RepID=A0A131ZX97_SARSC|nr:hypothetical protein SSS_10203 [Sarcoptes scabiei]KPM03119.1 hypothetical protein QR98_0015490 [Sarcoptes scabiei]UXI18747.1 hypothetical protein NH340_JMT04690 [Sarcoptes scabiei]